jgi:hypothetical protein
MRGAEPVADAAEFSVKTEPLVFITRENLSKPHSWGEPILQIAGFDGCSTCSGKIDQYSVFTRRWLTHLLFWPTDQPR